MQNIQKKFREESRARVRKSRSIIIALVTFFTIGFAFNDHLHNQKAHIVNLQENQIQICFTPGEKCRPLILKEIAKAQNEILMQVYSFTETEIAEALVAAQKRGVNVSVIFDASQLRGQHSKLNFVSENGIKSFIDHKVAIAHNKVIIIDRNILITGSYNFSEAAEKKNAENLLIIKNPEISNVYANNWHSRKAESKVFLMPNHGAK